MLSSDINCIYRNRKSFGARHKSTYLQTGVHGKQESASLLVDIPINDELR